MQSMSKNYGTAKSNHVLKEMSAGKTKKQANRSWSHGANCPMKQWYKENSIQVAKIATVYESNYQDYEDIG